MRHELILLLRIKPVKGVQGHLKLLHDLGLGERSGAKPHESLDKIIEQELCLIPHRSFRFWVEVMATELRFSQEPAKLRDHLLCNVDALIFHQ